MAASYLDLATGYLRLSGRAVPQLRATGEMQDLSAAIPVALTHGPPLPVSASPRHIIFTRSSNLTAGKSLIPVGTAGLISARQSWGTVLDVSEGDGGEVQVETDEWGTPLFIGLTTQRKDITVRCRLLTTSRLPEFGDTFNVAGEWYVVLTRQRISKSTAARELSVTGARWDGMSMSAEQVTGTITGWSG